MEKRRIVQNKHIIEEKLQPEYVKGLKNNSHDFFKI